jgi:hypothetical protein
VGTKKEGTKMKEFTGARGVEKQPAMKSGCAMWASIFPANKDSENDVDSSTLALDDSPASDTEFPALFGSSET